MRTLRESAPRGGGGCPGPATESLPRRPGTAYRTGSDASSIRVPSRPSVLSSVTVCLLALPSVCPSVFARPARQI